mgnify:CR=1 FL=1
MMFTNTAGTSAPIMYETPSSMRLKPGDDVSEESTQTWDRDGPWAVRVKEEVEAVRDTCGMLPITGFSRIKVEGSGAREFVDGGAERAGIGPVAALRQTTDVGLVDDEGRVLYGGDETAYVSSVLGCVASALDDPALVPPGLQAPRGDGHVVAGCGCLPNQIRYLRQLMTVISVRVHVYEEILEIFLEESDEELASLREHLPRWIANHEDRDRKSVV